MQASSRRSASYRANREAGGARRAICSASARLQNSTNFAFPVTPARLTSSENEYPTQGNNRTPALDATQAVDALLEGAHLIRSSIARFADSSRRHRWSASMGGPQRVGMASGLSYPVRTRRNCRRWSWSPKGVSFFVQGDDAGTHPPAELRGWRGMERVPGSAEAARPAPSAARTRDAR